MKLSDNVSRKFIESLDVSDWEVYTDTGWEDISKTNLTIPYEVYRVELENGLYLDCADNHILITIDNAEIFAKDSIGEYILTEGGYSKVYSVKSLNRTENMYDLTVDSENHTYYTNNILSHNSQVVAAYILWYTLFNEAKTTAILANKSSAAREIMDRLQYMYEGLPLWMQSGVKTWNKGSIELENNSKVFTAATTASGIRGKSINFLYVDEVAIIPNTIADSFFTSVMPTISSGTTTKIVLTSTPLGYNHWWKLWVEAESGKNGYTTVPVKFSEHPRRDAKWAAEQLQILGALKYTQEVECSFIGSSATLLNATTISNLSPEIYTYTKDNFDVLVKPKKNHVYVMIVDTSKGVRGDYSAFVIVDISEENYTVVAKYRSNEISPLLYPSIIVKIAKEYNNAFVLLEINSSEQVAYIVRQEYEYENLLSVVMGKSGQQIGGGFKSGSRYGVNTDKKVKRIGCGNLKNLVESGKLVVRDNDIIKEFSTFVENGRGSYEADDGYNDDLVMCLVLFGWLANDSYFKDLTDTNLRRMMYEEEVKYIEDNLIPFGFLQNNSVLDIDKENPFLTF